MLLHKCLLQCFFAQVFPFFIKYYLSDQLNRDPAWRRTLGLGLVPTLNEDCGTCWRTRTTPQRPRLDELDRVLLNKSSDC
jgi:hypothetical protein